MWLMVGESGCNMDSWWNHFVDKITLSVSDVTAVQACQSCRRPRTVALFFALTRFCTCVDVFPLLWREDCAFPSITSIVRKAKVDRGYTPVDFQWWFGWASLSGVGEPQEASFWEGIRSVTRVANLRRQIFWMFRKRNVEVPAGKWTNVLGRGWICWLGECQWRRLGTWGGATMAGGKRCRWATRGQFLGRNSKCH